MTHICIEAGLTLFTYILEVPAKYCNMPVIPCWLGNFPQLPFSNWGDPWTWAPHCPLRLTVALHLFSPLIVWSSTWSQYVVMFIYRFTSLSCTSTGPSVSQFWGKGWTLGLTALRASEECEEWGVFSCGGGQGQTNWDKDEFNTWNVLQLHIKQVWMERREERVRNGQGREQRTMMKQGQTGAMPSNRRKR